MELCPPEILLNIFTFACTDGGHTGCSLSLVSHHIHATSLSIRYHTVALWSLPRMRSFQSVFAANSSQPPIVRHLFLVDAPDAPYYGHSQESVGTEALEIAASIISTLAQGLVTLSGRLRPSQHHDGVEQIDVIPHLPLLQDLSLGFMGPYSISPGVDLPNLRRLHKWDISREQKDLADVNVITRAAPQLMEIRVSNVASICIQTLNAALKDMQLTHDDVICKLQIQDQALNLKHLFIQVSLAHERFCQFWRNIVRSDTAMIPDTLQDLLQNAVSSRLPKDVFLLPLCDYDIHDCFEDWLDVIEGGDGCWRIPPRKTTSTLSLERETESKETTSPSTTMLPS